MTIKEKTLSIILKCFYLGLLLTLMALIACNDKSAIEEVGEHTQNSEAETENSLSNEDETQEIIPQQVTEISFYTYFNSDKQETRMIEIIEKFQQEHHQVKVNLKTFSKDVFMDKYKEWIISETPPDVMSFSAGDKLTDLAEKNLISPLNEIFKAGYDMDFPSQFQQHIGLNSVQYILPMGWEWFALYYNKSLFDEHGLSLPKSYSELMNLCKALKDKGLIPLSIGIRDDMTQLNAWFDYLTISLKGITFYNDLIAGDIDFTDQKVKQVIEAVKDHVSKGYFNNDYTNLSIEEAIRKVDDGEAFMTIIGQSSLNHFSNLSLEGDLGYFNFPINDSAKDIARIHIEGVMVPEKSVNKPQAKLFAKFMATKEVQQNFNENTSLIPANKKTFFENLHSEVLMDTMLNTEQTYLGYDKSSPEGIAEYLSEGIKSILSGSESIDSFLFSMEKERRRIIEGQDVSNMLRANLLVYSNMNTSQGKNLLQSIINRFRGENPYINITVNHMASDQIGSEAESWLKSDNPPDIITVEAGRTLIKLAVEGLLEPIDDIFEDGFDSVFYKAFRRSVSVNDNIYMVPKSFDWFSIYYREGFFEDYNLEPPADFSEFLNLCRVIEFRRAYPIAVGTKDGNGLSLWFDYINLKTNGIDFYNKFSAGNVPFTNSKVVSVFETLGDMIEKDYFTHNPKSFNVREAVYDMFRKNAGFYLGGVFVHDLAEGFEEIYYVKHELEQFKFPQIDKDKPNHQLSNLDGFVMSSRSSEKEAAKRFLKFLTEIDIQQDFVDELKTPVAGKGVAQTMNTRLRIASDIILSADSITQPTSALSDAGFKAMLDDKLLELLDKPEDVSRIIDELEEERKRLSN